MEKAQLVSQNWNSFILASAPDLPLRLLCIWRVYKYAEERSRLCMRDIEKGSPIHYHSDFIDQDYDCERVFKNCVIEKLPILFQKSIDAMQMVENLEKIFERNREKLKVMTCLMQINYYSEIEPLGYFPKISGRGLKRQVLELPLGRPMI